MSYCKTLKIARANGVVILMGRNQRRKYYLYSLFRVPTGLEQLHICTVSALGREVMNLDVGLEKLLIENL